LFHQIAKKWFLYLSYSRYGFCFVLSFTFLFLPSFVFSLSLVYRIGWDGWVGFYHFLISFSSSLTKQKLFFFCFFLFSFPKFNAAQSNSIPPQFFCSQSLFIYLVSFFLLLFLFL